MTAKGASGRHQDHGHNALAALARNTELFAGRVGLLGLPLAELPEVPLGQSPLVVTEHAGIAARLEQSGGVAVRFGYQLAESDLSSVDTLAVFVPKAREALAMHLELARSLLSPHGQLVLVGEKREGIAGAARQLQTLAPDARKVDSARHCQVWQARLPEVETAFEPESWLKWHQIDRAGTRLQVAGMPGIFSDGRLDEGTARLLDSLAERPVKGSVLDFACGAGVIGAWLHSRWADIGAVDGVDVQAQAVFCARNTYQRNGVGGQILASDGLPEGLGRYQTIVTNPPFHSGVHTDTSMTEIFLKQARDHLEPGGELRLVANRFLPYRELIETHLGPCEVLSEDSRFTVYQAFNEKRRRRRAR